jgi:hypothetical protein
MIHKEINYYSDLSEENIRHRIYELFEVNDMLTSRGITKDPLTGINIPHLSYTYSYKNYGGRFYKGKYLLYTHKLFYYPSLVIKTHKEIYGTKILVKFYFAQLPLLFSIIMILSIIFILFENFKENIIGASIFIILISLILMYCMIAIYKTEKFLNHHFNKK